MNSYCEKLRKFYRKVPVMESFFSKVAGFYVSNITEEGIRVCCIPVNFPKFLLVTTTVF